MKASTSSAKSKTTAKTAKAKTTKAKAKPKYTAAQNASYKAWVKAHPFKNDYAAWIKAHPFKKTTSGAKATASTAKRTLSLHGAHVISKGPEVKLGRLAPHAEADRPRLVLDRYLTAIGVPPVVDYASQVVSWPMYGNDTIGDCTAATVGHQIQAWTCYTGAEVTVPQDDIIELYSAVSGYDPATGANDNGAAIQDVLTFWRKSGVPVAGHKILAFAQLKDLSLIRQALYVFGSVYLGINFPGSAMDQFNADEPWTVVAGAQIEGGHAIPLQYAGTGACPYQVVTWGKLEGMDQGFLDTYCEEAWVVITDDWLAKNGHTPEGLDLQQLGADLSQLTGDPNPFPAPPAPVPPAPPAPAPAPPAPAPPAPSPDPSILQQIEHDAEVIIQDAEKIL